MTKPTNEEIAALERWHVALADAERALSSARPLSVRYEVLDLCSDIVGGRFLDGSSLLTAVRVMRRESGQILDDARSGTATSGEAAGE